MFGDKRESSRQPVLRAAKVLFGGSAVDCLILDISEKGVRISTETFMPFPEDVLIELRTGGVWAGTLRWQRGMETGFELNRFAGLHAAAAAEASVLYDQLRHAGIRDVTERLSLARHFDHPELKSATTMVEVAIDELERVLRMASGRGMSEPRD